MVPLIVWLIITGEFLVAFLVFVLAGMSDGVDGFIAKRFNQTTELGAYLDPIADKLLLVSIYVSLGFREILPPWLVIMVVSRDILIVGALVLSWLMDRPVPITPLMVSKANTTAQIVLAALVLGGLGFGLAMPDLIVVMSIMVAVLTVLSAAAYLRLWLMHMANGDGA
jgi:cardiolipin synthase